MRADRRGDRARDERAAAAHTFPSMIDDWVGIRDARERLRSTPVWGGNPRGRATDRVSSRGAPFSGTRSVPRGDIVGPQFWGLRGHRPGRRRDPPPALLVPSRSGRRGRRAPAARRRCPVAALTAPSLAIDIARYGPQEPLSSGCMALGAVLLVRSRRRPARHAAVAATTTSPRSPAGIGALGIRGLPEGDVGLRPRARAVPHSDPPCPAGALGASRRAHDDAVSRRRRARGCRLPFVPMVLRDRPARASGRADLREIAAPAGASERLRISWRTRARPPLAPARGDRGRCPRPLAPWPSRTGVDWLSVGLPRRRRAFVLFAAEAGVVASRYYLPTIVLAALALARSAARLGPRGPSARSGSR